MSIAFSEIFLHRPAGYVNCVSGFAPNGRLLFLHRLTRAHELPQAGSPLTGGSFSAPESRGARTALACSPLTGGGALRFSGGDSPSADGGNVAAPAAGAKRKGHLRFPFLFGLLPFPCFLIWRRFPICDRFEKEYGSRVTAAYLSPPFRSSQTAYCYAYGLLYAGATYLCRANRFHVIPPSTYGF